MGIKDAQGSGCSEETEKADSAWNSEFVKKCNCSSLLHCVVGLEPLLDFGAGEAQSPCDS